jgi:hypothetical protein
MAGRFVNPRLTRLPKGRAPSPLSAARANLGPARRGLRALPSGCAGSPKVYGYKVGGWGLNTCDTAGYGDGPASGPFPLRSTIPAEDTLPRRTDDGSDLFGHVVPAVDMLAGANRGCMAGV